MVQCVAAIGIPEIGLNPLIGKDTVELPQSDRGGLFEEFDERDLVE